MRMLCSQSWIMNHANAAFKSHYSLTSCVTYLNILFSFFCHSFLHPLHRLSSSWQDADSLRWHLFDGNLHSVQNCRWVISFSTWYKNSQITFYMPREKINLVGIVISSLFSSFHTKINLIIKIPSHFPQTRMANNKRQCDTLFSWFTTTTKTFYVKIHNVTVTSAYVRRYFVKVEIGTLIRA